MLNVTLKKVSICYVTYFFPKYRLPDDSENDSLHSVRPWGLNQKKRRLSQNNCGDGLFSFAHFPMKGESPRRNNVLYG